MVEAESEAKTFTSHLNKTHRSKGSEDGKDPYEETQNCPGIHGRRGCSRLRGSFIAGKLME